MALPSESSETEMKWVLKAGIHIDPETLATNLTNLCTVAFSATVLYVMYSNNSRRPELTQYTQDSEAGESSGEDHSIVGNTDRTRPPESSAIPLDVVQSRSSYSSRLDAQTRTSSGGRRQDAKSCGTDAGIDDAQTQTVPELISVGTESVVDSIQSLLTLVEPSTSMSSVSGSDKIVKAQIQPPQAKPLSDAGIDDAQTQTVPELISVGTESFHDSIQSLLTLVEPSASMSSASGFDKIVEAHIQPSQAKLLSESSSSHTLPPTTSVTGSGPDLHSGSTKDPGFTSAKDGFLRHMNEGESNREEIDAVGKDMDFGNHFEGYIYGMIREKGSTSYKQRLNGGVPSESRQHGDGDRDGVRFKDACTQLENGVEVCENITTVERPPKLDEAIQKNNMESVSAPSGPESSTPRQRDSGTSQTEVKAEKATSVYGSREAGSGRPSKQSFGAEDGPWQCYKKRCLGRPITRLSTNLPRAESIDKDRDQVSNTSVGNSPENRSRGAWTGRPFNQRGGFSSHPHQRGVDETLRVEERIRSEVVQPEPMKPTKSSLVALTETEHWSKMSLSEQYDYLGSLDSSLAAASAEWKGNNNVTYWRHKDLDRGPSKLSGSASLCKSQGSTECPNMDGVHLHFQGDSMNIANSGRGQVFTEVTCVLEAHEDTQVHRPLSSNHNDRSPLPFATGDGPTIRPQRSVQKSLHDDLNRSFSMSAECRRLRYEAVRETRKLDKLVAKNSKFRYL